MLLAVGEGEKSGVLCPPSGEAVHDWFHQTLPYATIPQVGANGQRTEEANTAPVGGEVRPDKFAADLGAESGRRVGMPARPHVARIAHEGGRLWQAQERAES